MSANPILLPAVGDVPAYTMADLVAGALVKANGDKRKAAQYVECYLAGLQMREDLAGAKFYIQGRPIDRAPRSRKAD